ncbi:MAG: nitronate monooxygenase [Solirubrobacteraceae bacterium]
MLTPEAGTSAPWRRAVASDRPTAVTRAFSGRRARGIVNEWMERVGDAAPSAYPELVHLTSPLRKRSAAIDSPEFFSVWAGERHAEARALPVADLLRELAEELSSVGGA